MNRPPLHVIGELMNHSYGRARKAWLTRNVDGYQELAQLQTALGVSYLTLNIDGTRLLPVTLQEMLDFLPQLIPAIQQVSPLPISFDNPDVAFHRECLKHYDPAKASGRPILNSIAVSRHDVAAMIQLVKEHDMNVIVMASECVTADGLHGPATSVEDILGTTRHFVQQLQVAGIGCEHIIVDPGLAPIASDTSGLINLCLDSIAALRADPGLAGIHISVGLSNFALGAPKAMQVALERAFLRLAMDAGMDFALANPEKNTVPLARDATLVRDLSRILDEGRVRSGESAEDAGYRQLDALMELWSDPN